MFVIFNCFNADELITFCTAISLSLSEELSIKDLKILGGFLASVGALLILKSTKLEIELAKRQNT